MDHKQHFSENCGVPEFRTVTVKGCNLVIAVDVGCPDNITDSYEV